MLQFLFKCVWIFGEINDILKAGPSPGGRGEGRSYEVRRIDYWRRPGGVRRGADAAAAGQSVLLAAAGPGALAKAPLVDNYPGVPHIPGAELTARLQAQARDAGAELREALVQRVLPMGGEFSALLGQEIVQARAVLLANWARPGPGRFRGRRRWWAGGSAIAPPATACSIAARKSR